MNISSIFVKGKKKQKCMAMSLPESLIQGPVWRYSINVYKNTRKLCSLYKTKTILYFHIRPEVHQAPLVSTLSLSKDHSRNIHTLNGAIFSSWASSLVLFSCRLFSPVPLNWVLTKNNTISLHRLDLALHVPDHYSHCYNLKSSVGT